MINAEYENHRTPLSILIIMSKEDDLLAFKYIQFYEVPEDMQCRKQYKKGLSEIL